MSLLPYKITALARTDAGGLNIIPLASVSILTSGGGFATLREADLTTPIGNPFNCDSNGEREVWIAGGEYSVSVEGGQSWDIKLSGASDIQSVATIADLRALVGSTDGQAVDVIAYYDGWAATVAGPVGGGRMIWDAALTTTDNGVTIYGSEPVGRWRRVIDKNKISIFDAGGRRDQDIQPALQACVDAAPSTFDITSAYIYEPSWNIDIPYGDYFLSSRVLIAKNNIIIRGAGMFNTNIYSTSGPGDAQQEEMIRFRGAYACGLEHLTLDGGLPFSPAGTETYGCQIPLVLDQVAHLKMDGVNVCNYRTRGIQCIHVWESDFGEVRCFSGGYFSDALGIAPGGIVFSDFRKEENFFPGSESNQIYIAKYAISAVGSVFRCESPCFNIKFNHIVAEGRTYSFEPEAMETAKFYIDGLSSLVCVDQAWCYFHDQTFASNAVLFDFANAGPRCAFKNIFVYQEVPAAAPANIVEVSSLIRNSSASKVHVEISVQDIDTNTDLFDTSAAGSLITGDIEYRNADSRTISDFMTSFGPTNFIGDVSFSVGALSTTPPIVYQFDNRALVMSTIDGAGIYPEFKCRATANFNGNSGGGTRMSKGFSSITRTGVGNYDFVFTDPLPDVNYSVTPFCQQNASNTDHVNIAAVTENGFTLIVEDAAGVDHDTSILSVSVYR